MKEAKLIHARAFKCLDNPGNVAIFLKYYAKGEKPANHGVVLPLSFLAMVESDQLQLNCSKPYQHQVEFGPEDGRYVFTYGITKSMSWGQLFKFMAKWVKKTIDMSDSEFDTVTSEDGSVTMPLIDLLSKSDTYKMKTFKGV